MRFGVLGPVEVWDGRRRLAVGGPQQRELLAVLLLNANRVVSVDRLVEHLWGERPPATARSLLQGCVAGLRRALRDAEPDRQRLQTVAPGYRLQVAPGELDLDHFEQLAQEAAEADPSRAAGLLAEALGRWRGPALDGLRLEGMQAEVTRLEERRLAVLEQRIELDLGLGGHAALIPELRILVREHPLRERLWAQLMLALHRADRRAEALDAYRELRHTLVEQLGIEPGAAVRELHRTILAEPPEPVVHPPLVPAQLPAGLPAFVGRDEQLKQLDELLADPADGLPIGVVTGLAGVGKTSVAVHWAHRVRHRFPDGQLYVDLRGFNPSGRAASPAEVTRGFLDAFGTPPDRIPATPESQTNLYRSLLADRRVLIVLDNASDPEQVRPLLPGSAGCLVLVTSRNQLSGLAAVDGARRIPLGPLLDADAHRLLERRLEPVRVAAEPDAVEQILARCAGLPLALAIVAAQAATHPEFPLAVFARELAESGADLDPFADQHDPAIDIRSVFSWSYRALAPGPARVFRLLGLHPGPDIGTAAAASLAGVPADRVRELLGALARASLLMAPTPDRYRLHDLLQAYAGELGATVDDESDRRQAFRRVVDYYLHTAHTAYLQLHRFRLPMELAPPAAGVQPMRFADEPSAAAWFAVELPGLVATVDRAIGLGWDTDAWRLAWAFASFLEVRGRWQELASTQRTALAAAQRIGDGTAEARSHRALGRAYLQLGALAEAEAHLRRSLDLSAEFGDRRGLAHTHRVIAMMLEGQDRVGEAIRHASRSLELHRELGNEAGQAATLSLLGWCHTRLGEHGQALECCTEAIAGLRRCGDRPTEAHTWDSLGHAHHHLGEYAEAEACYGRAIAIFRELDDRFDLAASLTRLGDTHAARNGAEPAQAAWREAVRILDELGAPDADRVRVRLG